MTHKVIHPPSVNTQDAPYSRHSNRSYRNQSIGYYKESSDSWLNDPKEHKEEQELRGNWLKVCYLLHIIHPQPIFPIFLITFLNSDIDLLDLTKLGNLFQIKDPRKRSTINCRTCGWNEKYWTLSQLIWNLSVFEVWPRKLGIDGTNTFIYFRQ